MPHIRFEEPVTVMVGMGLPVRIETVMEAYALLQGWPPASRNGAHAAVAEGQPALPTTPQPKSPQPKVSLPRMPR